jgi:uncharacterized protein (UPF0212 family)
MAIYRVTWRAPWTVYVSANDEQNAVAISQEMPALSSEMDWSSADVEVEFFEEEDDDDDDA